MAVVLLNETPREQINRTVESLKVRRKTALLNNDENEFFHLNRRIFNRKRTLRIYNKFGVADTPPKRKFVCYAKDQPS